MATCDIHRLLQLTLRCFLGLCLCLASISTNALTLGEVKTESRLSETLRARIPLTASPQELADIRVALAPEEVFERFGVPQVETLKSLNFKVVSSPEPHINVTSRITFREPLVEFVLAVTSGNGTVFRRFAVFLSP